MIPEKPPLNSFAHFGVLGMKWGQRKAENKLSTEDRVIAKGTSIQTVTAGKAATVGDRRLFGSHTTQDKLAYKSQYASTLKVMSDNQDTFTNNLVVTKNIKVASEQASSDAFMKLYNSDKPGMVKALAESQEALTRTMLFMGDTVDKKQVSINEKALEKKIAKKGEDWVKNQGHTLFETAAGTDLVRRDIADSYYTSLSKMGYDAIVDKTDKGVMAEDPIVFLKPKNSLKLKETVPLTDSDIKLAGQKFKEEKKKAKEAS